MDAPRTENDKPSPTGAWWLSFADPDLPEGEQFLGVAIVEQRWFISAVEKAHELGINPGGQIQGVPVDLDTVPDEDIETLLGEERARHLAETVT